MGNSDLEKAFLEAAELAKKLPENLQEAGFNRALDQILGGDASESKPRSSKKRPPARTDAGVRGGAGSGESQGAKLVDAIDRTSYPDIGATSRVADRALKVLLLAQNDHSVDGLTAREIAEILTQKFRLPTKANSVTKALEGETTNVDIRSGAGKARIFHIMASGETYLEKLRAGEGEQTKPRSTRKRTRKKSPAVKPKDPQDSASSSTNGGKKKANSRSVSRPGPKAVIGDLIETGFFASGRTISAIQQELQHRRGYAYKVNELSTPLLRFIRDGVLARDHNEGGQYEYTEA